jgi:hypothetical protein
MRKYGLSRDQRAQVVRATNGSSRFRDIERILRASDLEESRSDDRRASKPVRRDTYAVQKHVYAAESDSSSVDADMLGSADSDASEYALAAENQSSSDEDVKAEIEEVFELQRKAKEKFKKSFKNYKDVKRKVKELKRNRQPYYPVVALNQPPDAGQPSSAAHAQVPLQKSTFRYDKKPSGKQPSKGKPRDQAKPYVKREEANMAETTLITSFAYMVEDVATVGETTISDVLQWSSEDALLASIPEGHAILDTGCTTSVVGKETSYNMSKFLEEQHMPPPEECTLPPVQLKGFKGEKIETTQGLRWHVKLGSRWGTVTTYVIPGQTPFLMSRRVLEGMQACLDLGKKTITSVPHDMHEVPLRQAANGHFVLPLYEAQPDFQAAENDQMVVDDVAPGEEEEHQNNEPNDDDVSSNEPLETELPPPSHSPEDHGSTKVQNNLKGISKPGRISNGDRRRAFQHVAKNTKNGHVDVAQFSQELAVIFGKDAKDITEVQIAYKPRLERIPKTAETEDMFQSVVTLNPEGEFYVTPWSIRPAGAFRCRVNQVSIAMFAHRPVPISAIAQESDHKTEPCCFCCNQEIPHDPRTTEFPHDDLEVLYEEVDWTEISTETVPEEVRQQLLDAISSLRKTQAQLVMNRVLEEPKQVRQELQQWLGPQAELIDQPVHFLEVFTGKAPLAKRVQDRLNTPSIKIGLQYGHDLDRLHDRRMLMTLIAYVRPRHIWFSFPCGCWGPWSRFNMSRGGKTEQVILAQRAKARRHLHAVSEAWSIQIALGGHCHAENPLTSEAWFELSLGEVYDIRIDQCALGLRCPKTKLPVLKPTRIITTCQEMAETLQKYRCDHRHDHGHLEGKYKGINLSKVAETYPAKFCNVVSAVIHQEVSSASVPKMPIAEFVNAVDASVVPAEEPDVPMPAEEDPAVQESRARARQIVTKLHVNTGHASPEQMLRLANRCKSSTVIKQAIKEFKCSICQELKLPSLHRAAAMPHAEQHNQVVGIDFVQVELSKEEGNQGLVERSYNVLTCVCLATDFCQQIVVPRRGHNLLSRAFHEVWTRPYGAPRTLYMDPHQINLSKDFQAYLKHHGINLLHCAAESHWQLGRVEIANRVLRDMARRAWRSTDRPVEEVIEMCASIRNQFLRKAGFSPSQWFLGQDPKATGWLIDVDAQHDPAVQSQILADPSFHAKIRLREEVAQAFHEAHAKDIWRRAIAARNRPIRGPYHTGQLVYFYRRRGRGQLSTRNGYWSGPARVIGVESSQGHFIPRIVWLAWNGYLYKCSPESLRPVPEDETEFRNLAKHLAEGRLHPAVESAEQRLVDNRGQFVDLTKELPQDDDFELKSDVDEEPDDNDDEDNDDDPGPHKPNDGKLKLTAEQQLEQPKSIRRRFYRSPEYWRKRALGAPPLGPIQEGVIPHVLREFPNSAEPPNARRKTDYGESSHHHQVDDEYEPTSPAKSENQDDVEMFPEPQDESSQAAAPPTEGGPAISSLADSQPDVPEPSLAPAADTGPEAVDPLTAKIPSDDELAVEVQNPKTKAEQVLEVSLDVLSTDIVDNPLFLWGVLDECLMANPAQTKLRRVEVNFRKLNPSDKKLFEKAMQKEWNSWVENKVTTICKSKGISPERIIKARWVLVWKKSSDPDDKQKTPKARLVLVGWQDPELGKIATDSPTLRKESKSMVLSICASKHWKLWGADIKTAFFVRRPISQRYLLQTTPRNKRMDETRKG